MAEHPEYGRTEFGEVIPLPELPFDLSGGQSLEGLGKTDIPVQNLPGVTFNFSEPQETPVLELSLYLRSGITSGEAALDLFRLCAAVNELALSHDGAGLRPTSRGDFTETEGKLRVVFAPAGPEWPREQLQKIVAAINAQASDAPRYSAIERYEARVA